MKKVLIISQGLSANGVDIYVKNISLSLNTDKYDITVALAIEKGDYQLYEKLLTDKGIKVIHLCEIGSLRKTFRFLSMLYKLIKENKYDIVYSNPDLFSGFTLFIAKICGVKKRVCHAHSVATFYFYGSFSNRIKILPAVLYRKAARKLISLCATDRLACSDDAGKAYYGSKPFTFIFNGIDIKKFVSAKNDKKAFCRQFNIEENKKIIVTVARMNICKNPIFAVETISELKKIRNDFHYVWIGNGEMLDDIKAAIQKYNAEDVITLAGVQSQIPEMLSCCDLFFLPSLIEALPISAVEAQAAGLECVVSDIIPEKTNVNLLTRLSLSNGSKYWAEQLSLALDSDKPEADNEKLMKFDASYSCSLLEKVFDS